MGLVSSWLTANDGFLEIERDDWPVEGMVCESALAADALGCRSDPDLDTNHSCLDASTSSCGDFDLDPPETSLVLLVEETRAGV
jgi:hypothetical protein